MTTLTQAAQHATEHTRRLRSLSGTVISLELLNYTQYGNNGYCFIYRATINDEVEDGVVAVVYIDGKWEIAHSSGGGNKLSEPRPTEGVDLVGSARGDDHFQGLPYAITQGFVNNKQISRVRVTYDNGDIVVVPVIARTFLAVLLPTSRREARVIQCEGLDDNDQVLYVTTRSH